MKHLTEGNKAPDENVHYKALKSALHCHDLITSLLPMKIPEVPVCCDYKVMISRIPQWKPSRNLKEFHAADRSSETTNGAALENHKNNEVLEMALSKNHIVGTRLSKRYTTIIECPDQEELFPLPPPPPKGNLEKIRDSFQDMVRTVTLEPKLEKPSLSRWVPVESRTFEIHLCQDTGPIKTQSVSKNGISIFSRRATVEEIQPYKVEFHISQKAWYEQIMIWMLKRAESSALHQNRYLPARCSTTTEEGSISESTQNSFDSPGKKKIKVPVEIELFNVEKPKPRQVFKAAPSMDSIWIPEYDVVVGIDEGKAATTLATKILKSRVVPFFGSKTQLRRSQVNVMTLMLQEELKDEEKFAKKDLPMANFWMMIADCDDEEQMKEGKQTKWLRKENGDFLGPFVHASDQAIYKAAVEWVREFTQKKAAATADEPLDPEPCQPPPEPREPAPTEARESPLTIQPLFAEVDTKPQGLFNMTGPIETLDNQAKEICQKWVNDSDTLLTKAAKKTLIDSFQTDFHSFLFLFQLQLKRIKGGYNSNNGQGGDGSVVSNGDDTSWVSAEPSVKEEDDRVSDIEVACVAFMNQMGNNMARHYERLSGDSEKAGRGSSSSSAADDQELRDEQESKEGRVSPLDDDRRRQSGNDVQTNEEKQPPLSRAKPRHYHQIPDDPALVHKEAAAAPNLAETSIDLSTASTVQRFAKEFGVNIEGSKRDKKDCLPPKPAAKSPTRNRREEDDDSTYDERSEPTYGESLEGTLEGSRSYEPSLEDDYDEEERSRDHRRRHRDARARRCRDRRHDDYDDSIFSGSRSEQYDDDTYPTVETEPLESQSLTLTPSELSLDEKPRQSQSNPSWGLFWI